MKILLLIIFLYIARADKEMICVVRCCSAIRQLIKIKIEWIVGVIIAPYFRKTGNLVMNWNHSDDSIPNVSWNTVESAGVLKNLLSLDLLRKLGGRIEWEP